MRTAQILRWSLSWNNVQRNPPRLLASVILPWQKKGLGRAVQKQDKKTRRCEGGTPGLKSCLPVWGSKSTTEHKWCSQYPKPTGWALGWQKDLFEALLAGHGLENVLCQRGRRTRLSPDFAPKTCLLEAEPCSWSLPEYAPKTRLYLLSGNLYPNNYPPLSAVSIAVVAATNLLQPHCQARNSIYYCNLANR